MKAKLILDKISDALDAVCGAFIVLMIAGMVVCTGAQIVCRTWFTALSWSEELTRYLLIWSTFIGATCVYRHGGNIAITVVQNALPPKVGRMLRLLVHVLCALLFVVLLYYGIEYSSKLTKTATALPIKMKYVFTCIPICMGISLVHAVRLIVDELAGKTAGEEVKG